MLHAVSSDLGGNPWRSRCVCETESEGEKKGGRNGNVLCAGSGFPGGKEEMASAFLMQVTEMRKDTGVSWKASSLLTFHTWSEWVARGLMEFMLGSS